MTTETTNDRIMASRLARALQDREELTTLRGLACQLHRAINIFGDRLEARHKEETGQAGPLAAPLYMRLSRALDRLRSAGSGEDEQERLETVCEELPECDRSGQWSFVWDFPEDQDDAEERGIIPLFLVTHAPGKESRQDRFDIYPDLSHGFRLWLEDGGTPERGDIPWRVVKEAESLLYAALRKVGVND